MQTVTETMSTETPRPGVQRVKVRRAGSGRQDEYDTTPVDGQPEVVEIPGVETELDADLRRAKLLANWLDAKFDVGGIRFGLDSLVGLIPVAGDVLSFLAGLYPLHLARKHDLGKIVQGRMALNLVLDAGVGAIPLVGDVFDVAFKANLKNLKLLEDALEKKRRKGK